MISRYVARVIFLFAFLILSLAIYSSACAGKRDVINKTIPGPHVKGYELAWIQFVEHGLVQVHTVDTKIAIAFRPSTNLELSKYHVGWVTPVTFECNGKVGDCDLSKPYKLYIGGTQVIPLQIEKRPK